MCCAFIPANLHARPTRNAEHVVHAMEAEHGLRFSHWRDGLGGAVSDLSVDVLHTWLGTLARLQM